MASTTNIDDDDNNNNNNNTIMNNFETTNEQDNGSLTTCIQKIMYWSLLISIVWIPLLWFPFGKTFIGGPGGYREFDLLLTYSSWLFLYHVVVYGVAEYKAYFQKRSICCSPSSSLDVPKNNPQKDYSNFLPTMAFQIRYCCFQRRRRLCRYKCNCVCIFGFCFCDSCGEENDESLSSFGGNNNNNNDNNRLYYDNDYIEEDSVQNHSVKNRRRYLSIPACVLLSMYYTCHFGFQCFMPDGGEWGFFGSIAEQTFGLDREQCVTMDRIFAYGIVLFGVLVAIQIFCFESFAARDDDYQSNALLPHTNGEYDDDDEYDGIDSLLRVGEKVPYYDSLGKV